MVLVSTATNHTKWFSELMTSEHIPSSTQNYMPVPLMGLLLLTLCHATILNVRAADTNDFVIKS